MNGAPRHLLSGQLLPRNSSLQTDSLVTLASHGHLLPSDSFSPAAVALVARAPPSILFTTHPTQSSENQNPMAKTLKLDRNLTLIFFFDGHSLRPHPHFSSRLDTNFARTLNIRLLNVTRTTIRRASVTGASVRGATAAGEQMSLGSKCRENTCLESNCHWGAPFVLPFQRYEQKDNGKFFFLIKWFQISLYTGTSRNNLFSPVIFNSWFCRSSEYQIIIKIFMACDVREKERKRKRTKGNLIF